MTIRRILPLGYLMVEDREENCCEGWYWDDDMIAGLDKPEKENGLRVVLRFDGTVTTARLIRGGTIVKTATARCSPKCQYTHAEGARVAMERLFAKKEEQP